MHTPRSFSVLVAILLLGGFTACHKVHSTTQAKEEPNVPAETRPVVVAVNRLPAPVAPVEVVEPVAPAAPVPAAKAKTEATDLNPLHLEVAALETIHQLQLTRTQLERLAKLAPTTAHKAPARRLTKVSDEYQKTLAELRDALVAEDENLVTDLSVALDELREKENPDFDDVEITDAARRHTAEVLRGLSARQVMGYLAEFAEEFPDPQEKLTDALDEIRKEAGNEWQELRDEVAGQVAWLVAGLDKPAEDRLRERVKEMLTRVHNMKEEEYTTRKAELEKAAQGIVGDVGPTDVIRHFTERSLAELLSNPRLSAAVEALLKKAE